MTGLKSFKEKLLKIDANEFESFALELFRFQYKNNTVYNKFCEEIGINFHHVTGLLQIPFLPISLFKTQIIQSGIWKEQTIFTSSGTTASIPSRHYIEDLSYYLSHAEDIFKSLYGNLNEYVILALLPSYLERGGSSLVAMLEHFIKKTGHEESGFYLYEYDKLISALNRARGKNKKVILWGVTYALIDLAEKYNIELDDVIIIETGGMKGRREEWTRIQVHQYIKERLNVGEIHSEYGMTELMSQAYSADSGKFSCGKSMRIFLREINDPFSISNQLNHGVINIMDLANIHSCAFIATEDLGRINSDSSFEVLGRLDNSDIRGCNLLLN